MGPSCPRGPQPRAHPRAPGRCLLCPERLRVFSRDRALGARRRPGQELHSPFPEAACRGQQGRTGGSSPSPPCCPVGDGSGSAALERRQAPPGRSGHRCCPARGLAGGQCPRRPRAASWALAEAVHGHSTCVPALLPGGPVAPTPPAQTEQGQGLRPAPAPVSVWSAQASSAAEQGCVNCGLHA